MSGNSSIRARWAAVGAAVAVALGAGGYGLVDATISSGPKPVFVSITPCRLVDTRPAPTTVGTRSTPLQQNEIATFTVHGTNGNCTIPSGALAIATNVTAVQPTSDSFMTVFPADASLPNSSNLNWEAGQSPTPNQVTVDLSNDGKIKVFNERGTVNLIIDIVGYYEDHTHTEFAAVNHTHDERYLPRGAIVLAQGGAWFSNGSGVTVVHSQNGVSLEPEPGEQNAQLGLTGPLSIGAVGFRLASVRYCIVNDPPFVGGGTVVEATVSVVGETSNEQTDDTDRSATGCYTLEVSPDIAAGSAHNLLLRITDKVFVTEVRATYVPA